MWLYATDLIRSIAPSQRFIKSVDVRIILATWLSIHIREIGRMSNVSSGGPRCTPGCSSDVHCQCPNIGILEKNLVRSFPQPAEGSSGPSVHAWGWEHRAVLFLRLIEQRYHGIENIQCCSLEFLNLLRGFFSLLTLPPLEAKCPWYTWLWNLSPYIQRHSCTET